MADKWNAAVCIHGLFCVDQVIIQVVLVLIAFFDGELIHDTFSVTVVETCVIYFI